MPYKYISTLHNRRTLYVIMAALSLYSITDLCASCFPLRKLHWHGREGINIGVFPSSSDRISQMQCTGIFRMIELFRGHEAHTVYPKKYTHSFVVLCFVVVMQSFIMNSHEVFIHIHQRCFAGTGAIVRLPQCQ